MQEHPHNAHTYPRRTGQSEGERSTCGACSVNWTPSSRVAGEICVPRGVDEGWAEVAENSGSVCDKKDQGPQDQGTFRKREKTREEKRIELQIPRSARVVNPAQGEKTDLGVQASPREGSRTAWCASRGKLV